MMRRDARGWFGLILPENPPTVHPWAHSEKEVMPMVQLLRAVLANTIGRLLADLVKRLFD